MAITRTIKSRDYRRVLRDLTDGLSGRRFTRITNLFLGSIVFHTFQRISEAYAAKAQGGSDDLGNIWKPLSPATIAARPVRHGEIGELGIGGRGEASFKRRVRGLLTATQDRQWRAIYAKSLAKLAPVLGLESARAQAAKLAWGVLKARGAQSAREILGGRSVLIMRDTDRLYQSYLPGRVSQTSGYTTSNPDQLVQITANQILMGSNVPYAPEAAAVRPIIPDNSSPWVSDAIDAALVACTEALS